MCEICHEFNRISEFHADEEQSIQVQYYSSFVEVKFYNGIYYGRTSHHLHELNFCPECGKELKK